MFSFNTAGLLMPSSVIESTLVEFEECFAIDSPSDVRRILFKQYINYKNSLKELCNKSELKQWIDGSFVTKKLNPFDIDLITFIDFETVKAKERELKEFIYPISSISYVLDCYIVIVYPEDHKFHFIYKSDCSYWINQFDKTKPNRSHKRIPKGFIEIII